MTFEVPTGREEAFRFTPVKRIEDALASSAPGKVVIERSAGSGVDFRSCERGSDPRLGSLLTPADRYEALAADGYERAGVLTVPRHTAPGEATIVTVRGEGGLAFAHLLVDVEEGAEATVVLDHSGSATFLANAEFRVGDGARLTVVSLQDWDDDAVHLGTHVAAVGRDATFRSIVVSLGGGVVRLVPKVTFTAPGGDAELLGLFFADAGQHLEHRLLVDHAVSHCRSRVTYKGALQGEGAHTVWIGDVIIAADTVGTDTYELNRNLVLSDGAHADSVPNLEIYSGEVVGAGHASATGRFDDQQLFYLESRGIPADEARRLVVRGFFADVVQRIEVPALRERLENAIEAELERSVL
ncbi:MAG TPA: Fe-S cluster assembly protein SufD [Mycobacteriales bacterium]|jgi:Fe-S cluster assembly protein SufD|nr:Fe-S cluster assembly protein SufD [Mycobacteriales bacterium]